MTAHETPTTITGTITNRNVDLETYRAHMVLAVANLTTLFQRRIPGPVMGGVEIGSFNGVHVRLTRGEHGTGDAHIFWASFSRRSAPKSPIMNDLGHTEVKIVGRRGGAHLDMPGLDEMEAEGKINQHTRSRIYDAILQYGRDGSTGLADMV